ncbi:MAG: hypothetical protein V5783_09905 [Pontiella sp.]
MFHRWERGENFAKIVGGINIEFATGFDEAVDDGAGLPGVGAAKEQEVFFTDGGGPNGIFNEVIVDLQFSMLEIQVEFGPVFLGVVDCFSKVAFRKLTGLLSVENLFYFF